MDCFSVRNPRRGALVPGGHRSAPTEAAAETLDGIFDATEVFSELSCPTAPSVCRPLFSPAGSVGAGRSPLGSCAISDGGGHGIVRGAGKLPSQSPNGASVSPPARVLAAKWQTSRTDRRGSGDRLLGNVPLGRNSPFSKGPASAAGCTQAGLFFRLHVHIQLGVGGWRCPPYRRWPSRPPASL